VADEKQERPTLSKEIVEKLNEFLQNSECGKKITVNDLSKDVQFIILDYIKEHS